MMKQYIILNDPASNSTPPQTPLQSPSTPNKSLGFIILPFTEQKQSIQLNPTTISHQSERHPTYLLKHFPPRPHYYLPHTIGAQPGYCLSPLPPCLKDTRNINPTTTIKNTLSNSHHKSLTTSSPFHSSNLLSSTTTTTSSSSSSSSSSLPSSSHTIASSSTSFPRTSSSSLNRAKESKPTHSSITKNNPTEPHPPSEFESSSHESNSMMNHNNVVTKKVLPTPPCLSNRVRQTFLNKINSQQAESCAQLPRRKKKLVQPVA